MFRKRQAVNALLLFAVAATGSLIAETAAQAAMTKNISHSTAAGMCKNHGGLTSSGAFQGCSYKRGDKDYTVSCTSSRCTVVSVIKPNGGRHRTPITQINGRSNGTTHTSIKHPVNIGSGVKPVVGTGTNGGYKGGGPNQNGYKGGGPNQGGGHHR